MPPSPGSTSASPPPPAEVLAAGDEAHAEVHPPADRDRVVRQARSPAANPPGPSTEPLSENHRVFVAQGDRCWLVRLGDIRLFEASGNSTRVFFGNEQPLINRALGDLAPRLDERVFFQANRSQIVNLKAVRTIYPWFGGRLMAEIEGGHEVTLSRRRSRVFRERMSV